MPMTYVWEIARQARLGRWAWEALNTLADEVLETDWPISCHPFEYADRLHGHAQAMIAAAGQVSKLLKPQNESKATPAEREFQARRVKALNDIITAPDVVMSRVVRNSLEHFDARLDARLTATPEIGLYDAGVSELPPLTTESAISVRHLTVGPMEFYVLEDHVSLRELAEGLADVSAQARTWLDSNGASWVEKADWPQTLPWFLAKQPPTTPGDPAAG